MPVCPTNERGLSLANPLRLNLHTKRYFVALARKPSISEEPSKSSNPDPSRYQNQISEKLSAVKKQFENITLPNIEVFHSEPVHYRLRCEFKVWHEGNIAHYAMYHPGEHKKPYIIEDFIVASELVNSLMPSLLAAINASDILRRRLFSVEFLTTLSGQALITLLYHRPLDATWEVEASTLANILGADIIGRSRKQKIVLNKDYVTETLNVAGRDYHYQQIETGFTQPNGRVNQQMLSWALEKSRLFGGDLLELYCGNGNFTLPLAQNFKHVLATEIAKVSVNSALFNLHKNQINNVEIVRMSSEEITQALQKVRPFRRLKQINLDSYDFSTVFVDPPRSGLDMQTLDLLHRFDNILYISCNPTTLHENLSALTEHYDIKHFAIFDQFPYTPHLECGAILNRREDHH